MGVLVKSVWVAWGVLRRTLVVLLIVSLFALNVASVMVPAVASAMSTAVSAVTKVPSVYSRLSSEISKKNKALLKASGALTRAGKEIQFRDAGIKRLRGQVTSMKGSISRATKSVRSRVAKDAGRNVASVFGESIPYVGVAVAAGVTAYELKDACDTMRDMFTLEIATDTETEGLAEVDRICGISVPSKEQVWAAVKASPKWAWNSAVAVLPDVPDLPAFPELSMPAVDWSWRPWN